MELTREVGNETIDAIAYVLEQTGQAKVTRVPDGRRMVVRFYPTGAVPGRGVSLAMDTVGMEFTMFPIIDGHIDYDHEYREATASIATLPRLLSRIFGWTREPMKRNRRTSRRARRTSRRR